MAPIDAVALELEQLLPDDGFANAGGGLDDLVFIKFVSAAASEVRSSSYTRSLPMFLMIFMGTHET
jgi:hypothetical protein